MYTPTSHSAPPLTIEDADTHSNAHYLDTTMLSQERPMAIEKHEAEPQYAAAYAAHDAHEDLETPRTMGDICPHTPRTYAPTPCAPLTSGEVLVPSHMVVQYVNVINSLLLFGVILAYFICVSIRDNTHLRPATSVYLLVFSALTIAFELPVARVHALATRLLRVLPQYRCPVTRGAWYASQSIFLIAPFLGEVVAPRRHIFGHQAAELKYIGSIFIVVAVSFVFTSAVGIFFHLKK